MGGGVGRVWAKMLGGLLQSVWKRGVQGAEPNFRTLGRKQQQAKSEGRVERRKRFFYFQKIFL
jgi:hypothetical protein